MTPAFLPDTLIRRSIVRDKNLVAELESERIRIGADILFTGRLLQYWSDGTIKRLVTFEQKDGKLHPDATTPPKEAGPFLTMRWNPFNGLYVADPSILASFSTAGISDPESLLRYAIDRGYSMDISNNLSASEHLKKERLSLRELVRTNRTIRNAALAVRIVLTNIGRLVTDYPAYRRQQREIAKALHSKELVLDIEFGGLGDCLSLTSLPRLLKEQHGVDFYLSERSKAVFRHQDIARLCFELNPYFKGYRDEGEIRIRKFVHTYSPRLFFTDRTDQTLVAELEREFSLKGQGLPEIYYEPRPIPGYETTLLCDLNWFSGEKWGLYNDPALVQEEIERWVSINPDHTVEYVMPGQQDIFTYADKVQACGKFLCYFSGGNMLAVALKKPATVIVPENIEGQSLSLFFFGRSAIEYKRRKSITGYEGPVLDS